MNRTSPPLVAVAAFLALVLGGAAPVGAQETAAQPAMAEEERPALSQEPAGMVRFVPGRDGKARLGIGRKELKALIESTTLGRTAHVETKIEDEYSLSCPDHEVVLPSLWVGKYEVTCAQWHRFLEESGRVNYVVPAEGKPGARTLEEISRLHLLAEPFKVGGEDYFPCANEWKVLYDLNEDTVNPRTRDQDPKARPGPDLFRKRPLPPGTRITCYRWSVPVNWRKHATAPVQARPPEGWETFPVTYVSLVDAMAFAEWYGLHVLTENEWEAACRGPRGEIWPEGKEFDPLGHAWSGFNTALVEQKKKAPKELEAAKKRLETARAANSPTSIARAQAEVDRWQWVVDARELPDFNVTPPFVNVGMFPSGTSPCGAMDMIGNVQEWVSTTLYPYPGTDSKSQYIGFDATLYRGGNINDKDSLLTAVFRTFVIDSRSLLGAHYKSGSAGFRVGRYEAPGTSPALRAVQWLRSSPAPILPREINKAYRVSGPDLDVYRGIGIERVHEAAWNSRQPASADPAGKVFWLGQAQSLAVIPATGVPQRDHIDLKKAAVAAAMPAPGARDKREPRGIPFLGLLHMTDRMELKGEVRVAKVRERPLTAEERKVLEDEREARKKAEEDKDKEPVKEGGGDPPAPPEPPRFAQDGGGEAGGGDPPAGNGEAGGEEKEGGEAEDEPDTDRIPTTKKETYFEYEPEGFVRGADHPHGLLLGLQMVGQDVRPVLWEARIGSSGTSTAPGGLVLLEEPLVRLPKDCFQIKKVGRPGEATSEFDDLGGLVSLVFYVPVEGRSDWIEVRLKLVLRSYPTDRPWTSRPPGTK